MLRFSAEALILLGIAVTICRAFFTEGYMISTGSMAPSLLGFHRQLCCPACACEFARGAAAEADDSPHQIASASAGGDLFDSWSPPTSRCPLCGTAVPEAGIPRTEGDQLLVHKHHFDLRDPQRWEVVVFRNPQHQVQAYVKRVVGLPGETIELIDGDVYADGVLQRKPLAVQQSLRIPVDDFRHQPPADDPDWRPRWQASQAATGWRTDGAVLRYRADQDARREPIAAEEPDWIEYHHWIREGGRHHTRVPLADWPSRTAEPGLLRDGFRYDAAARELEAVGAISQYALTTWLERLPAPEAQAALRRLYERSHQPPLGDLCAYNHPDAAGGGTPIHDLMIELDLCVRQRDGSLWLALHDGCHELQCHLNFAAGVAELTADDKPTVHRTAPLPAALLAGETARVTLSQFDRQVLVAVDGVELFPPLPYAGGGERPPLPERPVRIGARGGEFDINGLRLDRDVYYTVEPGRSDRHFVLGADEFFVLGDNSPVSLDSRAWDDPAVHRSQLIGKPFVVHLPSRSQPVQWGDRRGALRVPDLSRVRYIR